VTKAWREMPVDPTLPQILQVGKNEEEKNARDYDGHARNLRKPTSTGRTVVRVGKPQRAPGWCSGGSGFAYKNWSDYCSAIRARRRIHEGANAWAKRPLPQWV